MDYTGPNLRGVSVKEEGSKVYFSSLDLEPGRRDAPLPNQRCEFGLIPALFLLDDIGRDAPVDGLDGLEDG